MRERQATQKTPLKSSCLVSSALDQPLNPRLGLWRDDWANISARLPAGIDLRKEKHAMAGVLRLVGAHDGAHISARIPAGADADVASKPCHLELLNSSTRPPRSSKFLTEPTKVVKRRCSP